MIRLRLDRKRRLQSFTAIPPDRDTAMNTPCHSTGGGLFDAAGLDRDRFEAGVAPIWTPPCCVRRTGSVAGERRRRPSASRGGCLARSARVL